MASAAHVLVSQSILIEPSLLPLFLFVFELSCEAVKLDSVLLGVFADLILTQREYSLLMRCILLLFAASLADKTAELVAEMGEFNERV